MIRVGAELVDVSSGAQLWGSRYSRQSSELFSIKKTCRARFPRAYASG